MARDHALASCAQSSEGVVRLYRWSVPTVSFGRNEPTVDRYRAESQGGDLSFVRRPTGGRAVLHDRELTYAVVFPRGGLGGLREAYHRINEGLVMALRSLGVPAEHTVGAVGGRAVGPSAGPCFDVAAPGEIVARGRKLAGSAQARIGPVILQHGSILLECDQTRLGSTRDRSHAGTRHPAAITLLEILGELPDWGLLVDALIRGLTSTFGVPISPGFFTDEEARAEASLRDHYESPQWTWRR